ncbi:hypothetical protein ElyMa_001655900, partial [Elysia marginata]
MHLLSVIFVSSSGQTIQSEPLEVFLIDRSETTGGSMEDDHGSDTDQSNEEICLNYELIHLGLAVIQPSPIKRTKTIEKEPEPDLSGWNPLQEEFESYRNSYKVNTDDPGVALVGY